MKLSTFKDRVVSVIASEDFKCMISAGRSRFKDIAQDALSNMQQSGYQPLLAQMAFASNFTGLCAVSVANIT